MVHPNVKYCSALKEELFIKATTQWSLGSIKLNKNKTAVEGCRLLGYTNGNTLSVTKFKTLNRKQLTHIAMDCQEKAESIGL